MNELLTAALNYAARGWRVFPCHSPRTLKNGAVRCSCNKIDCAVVGKHPRTANGLKNSTTDTEQIEAWWQKWPDANVAIETGTRSGFLVMDVDGAEGEEVFAQYPPPEVTYEVKTGNGRQLYFDYPVLGELERIQTKSGVVPSMDSRGDKNGYVIAPPSLHANGNHYEITADVPLANAPDWWLKMVTVDDYAEGSEARAAPPIMMDTAGEYKAYVDAAVNNETEKLRLASVGEQNEQINKSAFALGQFVGAGVLSESDARNAILGAVLSMSVAAGREPWTERNAGQTIDSGIRAGINKPRVMPERNFKKSERVTLRGGAARRYALGETSARSAEWNEDKGGADEEERSLNNGLYAAENGRTMLRIEKSIGKGDEKKSVEELSPVCDLVATITQVFREENGDQLFGIHGRTLRNRQFQIEVSAADITDPKRLLAMLSNGADASCVFYAGKEKHLSPSIKSFTTSDVEEWRRFNRTGWTRDGKEFIVPGMEAADMSIALPAKLPYRVAKPDTADKLARAKAALDALIGAQRIEMTTVCLASLLAAPMAVHCDWRGERSALFITGRTGSFKSAWATVAMCLFGSGFANEDNILKFGAGATNNARMKFFTSASDMPILVDNYKPGVNGKGELELVELIHAALEGGEKDRMNRDRSMDDSAPIHAWPFFTGEDTVHDTAAAARCLIVPFPLAPEDASNITLAQTLSEDLHYIGGVLIDWLLTDEARKVAREIRKYFVDLRKWWSVHLRKIRPDMANIYRVASNLAVNRCAYMYACECPELAPMLTPYADAHQTGLLEVAAKMAEHTAQSLEANRYLDALRAMLSSDRAYLCERLKDAGEDERRLKIGWEDELGVYLISDTAYTEALKMLANSGGLNGVSKSTVHKQLDQMGYTARKGKNEWTVPIRTGTMGKLERVIHLNRNALFDDENEAETGDLFEEDENE